MVSFALSYPRLFASAGIAFFFSLSYPLLPGSWGYHGFLRSLIPSPVCFCGYRILFLALIPATARLLGVSWFPSLSHTLACLLLRVSHSFSRSHTRCCPAPEGMTLAFLLSYPLLYVSWGYHNLFLNFIPTTSDNIYTIRYLPQITLTLNERFCLYNSENTRRY